MSIEEQLENWRTKPTLAAIISAKRVIGFNSKFPAAILMYGVGGISLEYFEDGPHAIRYNIDDLGKVTAGGYLRS